MGSVRSDWRANRRVTTQEWRLMGMTLPEASLLSPCGVYLDAHHL